MNSREWKLLEAFTVVYDGSQLHEICRKVDAGRSIESKVTFDVVQAVKNVPDTGYGAKARIRVFAQGVCRCQGQNAAVVFETRTDAFEVNLALRSNQKRKDSDKW